MKGGVYSDEKCPLCQSRFTHIEPKGLFCPDHPHVTPTRFKVKFGRLCKRFRSYSEAYRFLTGCRFKTDEKTYDPRDYQKDKPLGFENLARRWIEKKKPYTKSWRTLKWRIGYASAHFKDTNIKDIDYPELEDLVDVLPGHLSGKTRHDIMSTVRSLFSWCLKRRLLRPDQVPQDWPEIPYELGWRQTVTKEVQSAVIDEVGRISPYRVWIAVKWLSTYISIRPIELIHIQEKDFDLELGVVFVRHSKTRQAKIIPMLSEDLEIVRSFPKAFPEMPFFRHEKGNGGAKPGQRFGKDYLYKWWKKACQNLGVENIDLYGGTRHSSARALRELRTPEEIKRATMHSSNKAFERYFRIDLADTRSVYSDTVLTLKKPVSKPA